MWVSGLLRLVVLGYITKSMVLVSPFVKICDFLLSFFFFFSLLVCWSRIGAVLKKKKKNTARTPESGKSNRFWCSIRVGHRNDAKNFVLVQPRLKVAR